MKKSLSISHVAFLAIAYLLLPELGRAQTNQTYDGGSNYWDMGTTPDWSNGPTWAGGDDVATFNGSDTVTVSSGTVTFDQMNFNGAGTGTTISGPGTLEVNPFTSYNYAPASNPGDAAWLNDSSTAPVTISSQIDLSDAGPNNQIYVNNYGNSNLTLGNIDFVTYSLNPSGPVTQLTFDDVDSVDPYGHATAANTGSITLNGTYTTSGGNGGQIIFGSYY